MMRLNFFRRLILAMLAVLFGWLSINPIIRSTVVSAVELVSGADTTIQRVGSDWRGRKVKLHDVTIVDPHRAGHNLMQADSVELELEKSALLRRRAVVKRGHITGLRLGTPRDTIAAALSPTKIAAYNASVAERFQRVGGGWLESASQRVRAGWTNEVTAAQLAQGFAKKWPEQQLVIETNASRLHARAAELRQRLEDSGENRLRNRDAYRTAATQIEQLTNEINQVERHATQLQQQIRMDRDALTQASHQDSLSLTQQAGMAELDGEALSDYLVGAEVSESLADVLHWVAWSRRLTPMIANATESKRRGRDVLFGQQRKANVIIESLVMHGEINLGAGIAPLDGTIQNWSSNASMTGTPTEIVVQTGGATPMLVQAILDRTTQQPTDKIVIDCPRTPRQRRLLGSADDLSLTVSPGDIHTWCQIDLQGDQLSGKMLLRQSTARFTAQTQASLNSPEVSQALAASVESLKSLEISVQLGGTLTTPDWTLTSNLGPHVATALQRSFQEQLAASSKQQVLVAQQTALTELQSIETQLVQQQTSVMKNLRESLEAIQQVQDRIATRVRLTDGLIDPDSPVREVYRR